ncbi:hypothetical protein ACNQKP_13275 [Bdellovibrio bacteriovorus]|uniref:hypothetical protein n=1 Tax=Bdellovibrio bacteriovorus TaxID=959 RepID=UPI003AA90C1F
MAETVGGTLKSIRKKMGYLSARSFYMALEGRVDLVFNYSYYMKIEGGQIAPSDKVINQLAALLPQADGDQLVAAYCRQLFPKQMDRIISPSTEVRPVSKATGKNSLKGFQQELTERQVSKVGRTRDHYFLFLLLTLARAPLTRAQIETYDFADLETALRDLQDVKLLVEEGDKLTATFPEFVFPKAGTESIKKIYTLLDVYDQERAAFFKLEKVKRGSFFKRISPRQGDILLGHLELLFQTIRSADEVDVSYNSEVISFNVNLHKGPVKG